jgi:tRNA-Thr(GGU) m(6)t(6)A37 methyltransferase TsaA
VRKIVFRPIGVIHTPHREQAGAPIQPVCAAGARGTVTVFDAYAEALVDLAGFERIWLLYHFDRATAWKSRVVPYRDVVERGLFATRAPSRPNPIGLSAVRLLAVEGNTLHIQDVDVLDGTPLLDIKPYVSEFDAHPDSRAGWFDASTSEKRVADNRFDGGGEVPAPPP